MKLSAPSVITKSSDTAPNRSLLLIRWLLLPLTIVIELAGITYQFVVPITADDTDDITWAVWLFANSKEIWRAVVGFTSVFPLSFIPNISRFKNIISQLQEQSTGYRWWLWLIGHILALAAFIFITSLVFKKPTDPARLSAAWFAGWFTLASATFLLWLLAVVPCRFWVQLACRESKRLLIALLLGVPAGLLLLGAKAGPLVGAKLWAFLPKDYRTKPLSEGSINTHLATR